MHAVRVGIGVGGGRSRLAASLRAGRACWGACSKCCGWVGCRGARRNLRGNLRGAAGGSGAGVHGAGVHGAGVHGAGVHSATKETCWCLGCSPARLLQPAGSSQLGAWGCAATTATTRP